MEIWDTFVAIDFETATPEHSSACSIGIVLVECGEITLTEHYLIRPPQTEFHWACVKTHGIRFVDVADAGDFEDVWDEVSYLFADAEYIVAHNAAFDRSVLRKSLDTYGIQAPIQPFVCTMQLARREWGIYPAKLPDVCRRRGIPQAHHHDALEDALACARIMVHSLEEGIAPVFLS